MEYISTEFFFVLPMDFYLISSDKFLLYFWHNFLFFFANGFLVGVEIFELFQTLPIGKNTSGQSLLFHILVGFLSVPNKNPKYDLPWQQSHRKACTAVHKALPQKRMQTFNFTLLHVFGILGPLAFFLLCSILRSMKQIHAIEKRKTTHSHYFGRLVSQCFCDLPHPNNSFDRMAPLKRPGIWHHFCLQPRLDGRLCFHGCNELEQNKTTCFHGCYDLASFFLGGWPCCDHYCPFCFVRHTMPDLCLIGHDKQSILASCLGFFFFLTKKTFENFCSKNVPWKWKRLRHSPFFSIWPGWWAGEDHIMLQSTRTKKKWHPSSTTSNCIPFQGNYLTTNTNQQPDHIDLNNWKNTFSQKSIDDAFELHTSKFLVRFFMTMSCQQKSMNAQNLICLFFHFVGHSVMTQNTAKKRWKFVIESWISPPTDLVCMHNMR